MLPKQPHTEGPGASPSPDPLFPAAPTNAPAARSAIIHNLSCIGPGLKIKGEIAGGEDLQIEGKVEGTIVLPGHKLTVGRSGQLNCNVDAREVTVYGKVAGNIRASDLIEIKKDATVIGDIRATRISLEDGAHFRGYIDMEVPRASTLGGAGTPVVPSDRAPN